jgi:hypothetical protein
MTEAKVFTYDPKIAAIHTLRVNIKTLAAEAVIIRKEEKRAGICYLSYLRHHRTSRLREEARYTHLALAFVRGHKYTRVEQSAKVPVDAKRLANKINFHLKTASIAAVMNWLTVKI